MSFTCDVNGCGREAKAGGKCLGHALEERKKNEVQEPEKPAPKKRGRKPKTEKADSVPSKKDMKLRSDLMILNSLYSNITEQEFRSAIDMQNRLLHFTMNGRFPMRTICTNKDCGVTYEGRKIDHSIKCSEILLCSKCGSILLPEGEAIQEVEIVEEGI